MDWSLIMGRGGAATKRERGVASGWPVKCYPNEKGGGNVLAMLKRRAHNVFG